MADIIQHRRDTQANWEHFNPILAEGEEGFCLDDPNRYKMGDGVHHWNDLPYRGYDGTIVHEKGESETAVMSQKALTQALNEMDDEINANVVELEVDEITGDVIVTCDSDNSSFTSGEVNPETGDIVLTFNHQ